MRSTSHKRTLLLIAILAAIAIAVVAIFTVLDTRSTEVEGNAQPIPGSPSVPGPPGPSTPASPPTPSPAPRIIGPGIAHVHMGDSYAAGTGPDNLVDGVPLPCQRTTVNPGQLLSKRMKWTTRDVACASAKTENLYVEQYFGAPPQLDALSRETRVVTSVLGANDENFFDTLVTSCANLGRDDPSGSPCRDAYGETFRRQLTRTTGPNLREAYRDIASRAPNAEIFAVGYLWLVPESGACRPAMRFADGDIAFAREMQALLNKQVKDAVEAAGGTYVDMSERSDGHDACADADVRWIEPAFDAETGARTGLSANHPNPRGQAAMADALERAVRAHR